LTTEPSTERSLRLNEWTLYDGFHTRYNADGSAPDEVGSLDRGQYSRLPPDRVSLTESSGTRPAARSAGTTGQALGDRGRCIAPDTARPNVRSATRLPSRSAIVPRALLSVELLVRPTKIEFDAEQYDAVFGDELPELLS
jgi:hypothetical protein